MKKQGENQVAVFMFFAVSDGRRLAESGGKMAEKSAFSAMKTREGRCSKKRNSDTWWS